MRRAPEHPDAYASLSELFEARGTPEDARKALQLALVAAHLEQKNPQSWRRVGMIALDVARRRRGVVLDARRETVAPSHLEHNQNTSGPTAKRGTVRAAGKQ